MKNLPRDLEEEVLCRVPLTSLRKVRSTCKKWNILSKRKSFSKKYIGVQAKVATEAKEYMVVMMMEFRVYLMSINLHKDNVELCIKRQGTIISLDDSSKIDISYVSHCDGLLLCIAKDNTRLVVWNPYCGKTRWIKPTHDFHIIDRYSYALGYNTSTKSHKILRFIDFPYPAFVELKIYDLDSDSWRLLDLTTPDWRIQYYSRGVSLRGDTYWFATEKYSETREYDERFLVSFDFTRERFGPRLLLPFEPYLADIVTLSSVTCGFISAMGYITDGDMGYN